LLKNVMKVLIVLVVFLLLFYAVEIITGLDAHEIKVLSEPREAGHVGGGGRYKAGDEVELKASPRDGYEFSGWLKGDRLVGEEKMYTFKVEKSKTLRADFQPRRYSVDYRGGGGGEVESRGEPRHGETMSLIAVPADGYVFMGWVENGEEISSEVEYEFTVQGDRSLEATFRPVDDFVGENIKTVVAPAHAGEIKGEAHDISGRKLVLTAHPEFGYRFDHWEAEGEEVSRNRSYTVGTGEEKEVVARFEEGFEKVDGDDLLAPVNKETYLGRYAPPDLKELPEEINARDYTMHLREEALEHLMNMYEEAKEDGVTLQVASAYRCYDTQKTIFNRNAEEHGEEEANRFSARPGQSEHQLGTTVDFGGTEYDFSDEFAKTSQGEWLKENAYRFGFVKSYPEDSEDITGYIYEPWHYRYIGKDRAVELQETEKVLTEFLEAKRR